MVSPIDRRGHEFLLLGLPDFVLTLPFILGSATVGALVTSKRPANPIGWLLAASGLLAALDQFARAYAIFGLFIQPGALPAAALVGWLNAWTWQLTFGLTIIVLPLVFPTRRPRSRVWVALLWLAWGFIAVWTLTAAFGPRNIFLDWRFGYTLANPFGQVSLADWVWLAGERVAPVTALAAAIGVGGLAARLVRARGEERQQLKWIALAAGVAATGVLLVAVGAPRVGVAVIALGLTLVPLAAGVAILQHRLFDIDVVISNALMYVVLTAFVAGLYGGVTMLIQRGWILLAGQQSDATLVIAAIIAAVAFTPAKNRLQARVDDRFKSSTGTKEVATVSELAAEVARLRADVDALSREAASEQRAEAYAAVG
jgi:hypothetical protein